MTAIQFYFNSLNNETIKLKKTFAIWLTAICALLIPTLFFIVYLVKWKDFLPADGVNPWIEFINNQVRQSLPALVPLFIVLITSLIIQVEHKATALKHLFALPIPKWSVYFGKLTAIVVLVFITYLVYYALIQGTGTLLGMIHPELKFAEYSPNFNYDFKILFRSFTAVLGILSIQFWLSFRFKNFIIPLGVGVVLVIVGLIAARAQEAIYFPYSYAIIAMNPIDEAVVDPGALWWFPNVAWYSLGVFALFAIGGYIDIKRKNVK